MQQKNSIQVFRLSCMKNESLIFKEITFTLSEGHTLFVRGPNGSGKSTLLRILAGFQKPTQGSLSSNFSLSQNIHYFDEKDLLKPNLTPREHLQYWSKILFWDDPRQVDHAQNAEDCFSLMNLPSSLLDTPSKYLSYGQRKRVALSRILLKERKVWILDEPLLGLDAKSIQLFEFFLEQHLEKGGFLFLSSHSNMKLNHVVSIHLG